MPAPLRWPCDLPPRLCRDWPPDALAPEPMFDPPREPLPREPERDFEDP